MVWLPRFGREAGCTAVITLSGWVLAIFLVWGRPGLEQARATAPDLKALSEELGQLQRRVAQAELANSLAVSQAKLPDPLASSGLAAPPRQLFLGTMTTVDSNTAGSGCLWFSSSHASMSSDILTAVMDSTTCGLTGGTNDARCPPCFLAASLTANTELRVQDCSTMYIGSSATLPSSGSASSVIQLMFINTDNDNTLEIKAWDGDSNSIVGSSKTIAAQESVIGFCWAGGNNAIYFPS